MKLASTLRNAIIKSWQTALVLVGLLLFTSMLVWVPKWQVPATGLTVKERIETEDNARKTIAQILGGGFFLLTAYFTVADSGCN
jgi:hypothetical protein